MATCEFAECNIGVFLGGEGKREMAVGFNPSQRY